MRNPFHWFVWGLVSPIILIMALFDRFLVIEDTGYYDGREASEEVALRRARQAEAQAMINGYRNVDD